MLTKTDLQLNYWYNYAYTAVVINHFYGNACNT